MDSSGLQTLPAFRSVFQNKLKSELCRHRSSVESPSQTHLFKTESLTEVQFVVDSCRFVNQSNYLNNSNKDCDWFILACLIREQFTADAHFNRLENENRIQPTA